jgi:hypothetical protein
VLFALLGVGSYAVLDTNAHSNGQGIQGSTQKTSNSGCSCHCASSNSATTVAITNSNPPATYQTGQSYTLTLTVSNSSESGAGCDIAVAFGTLATITNQGLQLDATSGELTHTTPKTGSSVSWNFTYNAPNTACDDTIYATGNAVNLDNTNGSGNCSDKWNFAPKFVIHVVAPARGIAVNASQFTMGSVRVGTRKFATTTVQATGASAITISSTAMKTGSQFSTISTNGVGSRTINPSLTETDTVYFAPTIRGSFVDSLIINTNSDTAAKQRVVIPATGQGIQAVFTNTLNTLAFGNTKLAFAAPKMTFVYSNSGDDTLILAAPTITGSAFTISKAPNVLRLLPGATDSVVVQFSPTARQAYTGSLSFSASNAVTAPTIALSGTGIQAQLQASPIFSMGATRVGQTLQGQYSIKNIGNDTMHITNVALNPATGSRFTLGTFPSVLAPNATGSFRLTYSPTVEKLDSVQLKFSTDDDAAVNFTALVTASGVLPHMSTDTATTVIGQTKVNVALTHDFAVQNNGGADLTLNAVVDGDPSFSIVSAPQSVQAGSVGYVTVKFLPTAIGDFSGRLIVSGDDASNPSDTIHFSGSAINSALSITPSNVNFNYVPVGVTMSDTVKLSNSGNAPVRILSIKLTGSPAFTVTDSSAKQIAGGGTGLIIVNFKPTDVAGYTGKITVTTDETTPTRTINLAGAGVKGALTANPIALDFGTVDSGQTKTLSSTLKNTGSAAITLTDLALDNASPVFTFTATPATKPVTVQPNDSIVLNITFAPVAAGSFSGAIKLTTSDGTSGNIVTFAGQGHVVPQGNNGVADHAIAGLHMSLMPNPARTAASCMITLEEPQSLRMIIVDALGRQMATENLGIVGSGTHEIELPISKLSAGTCFVQLMSETGSMESKLVIAR